MVGRRGLGHRSVGGLSRDHEDIEICVPRTDQKALRELVADWQSFTPKENRWVPLAAGELLEYPASMWQLRHSRDTPMPVEGMPSRWEFLLNEVDGDESIFALDARIRLPLHHIIVRSSMEIPVMAPEVVLLHKAFQQPRPKDDHDFLWVINRLSPPQRGWLATHLRHLKLDHRWLPKLA